MGGAKTSPCTGTTSAVPSKVSLQRTVTAAIAVSREEQLHRANGPQRCLPCSGRKPAVRRTAAPEALSAPVSETGTCPASRPKALPITLSMV